MFIKLGQQQYVNTQYIETICVMGKNEVRVSMINSDNFYKYGVYDDYGEAVNAANELAERINKEKE